MVTDDIVTRLRRECQCTDDCRAVDDPCISMRAAAEIERLRECLQHAIDHVGKWQLFTAEEKQTILAEYEEAVRGDS